MLRLMDQLIFHQFHLKLVIEKENSSESFSVNEKFNFKKMTDKYEEKNYERNIKENFANSISYFSQVII